MSAVRRVIYLHGFASSPASSKATRFEHELRARRVSFACPDFNEPQFETLSVTRMLDQVDRLLAESDAQPVALVGSSLGGFVAVHAAARPSASRVDRLILLAPAFDFGGNRLRALGEHGIDEWRRAGRLRVFHYAANEERDVGFQLYEDAAQYDAYALPSRLPTLIFQGRQDETVDPETVVRWAQARSLVDLRLVEDGHQLAESMDLIWEESEKFLGIADVTSASSARQA